MLTKLTVAIISRYICPVIMLYTLNLYHDVCQLYLKKTEKINLFMPIGKIL